MAPLVAAVTWGRGERATEVARVCGYGTGYGRW